MTNALSLSEPTGGDRGLQPASEGRPHAASDLTTVLVQAYGMIGTMLNRLRESQGVLQDATVQKLQDTSAKLSEVSSTTLSAATDIMDGLDRALLLVDQLESGESAETATDDLRNEIFGVMNHLQFQDITTQQLQYASSLLHEMETQLAEFAQLFDPISHGLATEPAKYPRAFDPAATVHNAEQRQALVDELLTNDAR